ncbi:MAG: carboxymuconolactone decarboxylase family protein [Oscillospiraceae bacterium]|nr:carboxymuconolactone decarboxylase family protein [Oscillospiraceae bacterium]
MAEKHFFELLKEETPNIQKAFFDYVGTIQKDCGLDEKTFQLVYIGIQSSNGQVASVAAHAGMAKKAGATRDEVRGAVLVSMISSGVTGITECLAGALNAYDHA